MALSEVRTHIAAALADLGVPVHLYPPGAVSAPCVVLRPGSPYLDPGAAWGSRTVAIDVRIIATAAAGQDSTTRLDDLIDAAVPALLAATVQVGPIPAPDYSDETSLLTVDIPTTTVWKDD